MRLGTEIPESISKGLLPQSKILFWFFEGRGGPLQVTKVQRDPPWKNWKESFQESGPITFSCLTQTGDSPSPDSLRSLPCGAKMLWNIFLAISQITANHDFRDPLRYNACTSFETDFGRPTLRTALRQFVLGLSPV